MVQIIRPSVTKLGQMQPDVAIQELGVAILTLPFIDLLPCLSENTLSIFDPSLGRVWFS